MTKLTLHLPKFYVIYCANVMIANAQQFLAPLLKAVDIAKDDTIAMEDIVAIDVTVEQIKRMYNYLGSLPEVETAKVNGDFKSYLQQNLAPLTQSQDEDIAGAAMEIFYFANDVYNTTEETSTAKASKNVDLLKNLINN